MVTQIPTWLFHILLPQKVKYLIWQLFDNSSKLKKQQTKNSPVGCHQNRKGFLPWSKRAPSFCFLLHWFLCLYRILLVWPLVFWEPVFGWWTVLYVRTVSLVMLLRVQDFQAKEFLKEQELLLHPGHTREGTCTTRAKHQTAESNVLSPHICCASDWCWHLSHCLSLENLTRDFSAAAKHISISSWRR